MVVGRERFVPHVDFEVNAKSMEVESCCDVMQLFDVVDPVRNP